LPFPIQDQLLLSIIIYYQLNMCRWFAYISPAEPCLLSDVLITPVNSLSKQCSEHYLPGLLPHGDDRDLDDSSDVLLRMRNALLNMDGLGIGWYTTATADYTKQLNGPRPALYKSQSPPIVRKHAPSFFVV
jgi:glutamine amidotransferase